MFITGRNLEFVFADSSKGSNAGVYASALLIPPGSKIEAKIISSSDCISLAKANLPMSNTKVGTDTIAHAPHSEEQISRQMGICCHFISRVDQHLFFFVPGTYFGSADS